MREVEKRPVYNSVVMWGLGIVKTFVSVVSLGPKRGHSLTTYQIVFGT